jgi:NAD(P)-dependent dehydrogenase (short-subunit alcohol dehydrogenase family)
MEAASLSLSLGFEDTHVVVTGGGGLIGRVVVDHFLAAGARVSSLDIVHSDKRTDSEHKADADTAAATATKPKYQAIYCDVALEESVEAAFAAAVKAHGPVEICIALASLDLSVLSPSSFAEASFAQLKRVLDVNVAGTWLTAREWMRGLRRASAEGTTLQHPNLIIIGSESGHFGERTNAEYSLGKSAVQGGLLMSLRAEAPREWPGARVNAVAPGPVQTERWYGECERNPEQYYVEAQATVCSLPCGCAGRVCLRAYKPLDPFVTP